MIKTINSIIATFKDFVCDMFMYNLTAFTPEVKYDLNGVKDNKFWQQVDGDVVSATMMLKDGPFDGIRLYIYVFRNDDISCEISFSEDKGSSWWTDSNTLSTTQRMVVREMANTEKYLNEHYK